MRATILLYRLVFMLTMAHRTAVSIMAKGSICGLSTASEVFLILMFMQISCNSFHILTRGKYCNRNTPIPQYSPLLTSSG